MNINNDTRINIIKLKILIQKCLNSFYTKYYREK